MPLAKPAVVRDLLTAIDGTGDLIAAVDRDFRYVALNESYRRAMNELFACDLQLGDSMVEVLAHAPENQARAVEIWGEALRGEHVFTTRQFGGEPGAPRWYGSSPRSTRSTGSRSTGASR